MLKPLNVNVNVNHNKMWNILEEMGIPGHLTCLLRNLYAGQGATVRTREGTMDWFKTGEQVHQGCILSPCLFNLHAKYITWNAGLDEVQAKSRLPGEISITSDSRWYHPYDRKRRGTEEPLDESERGKWKSWLKTQHSKRKIMAPGPITSWQIDGEKLETVTFHFLGLHNHCRQWLQPWN